uniref:Putative secreted peptide n=1 Tax=Anopheles braziliensis TaxID=58242 RepID=A0A2M3ZV69_9DIPT
MLHVHRITLSTVIWMTMAKTWCSPGTTTPTVHRNATCRRGPFVNPKSSVASLVSSATCCCCCFSCHHHRETSFHLSSFTRSN